MTSEEQNGKEKSGTRVFKKTSPNNKITTYLGKRDFVDHGSFVETIDGMVLVDPDGVKEGQKVFAHLLAAFRYGREDLDVLGLTFRKDLITKHFQVYPPLEGAESRNRPLTRLQERLKKKLGDKAYPFWFDIPPQSASSVTLQPAPGDTGKPCGVDYELKTNVVKLAIRKLTFGPAQTKPQPFSEVSKEFMMSTGLLHMETSLDKELYYHGESVSVNIHIQNNSNKTIKKIKVGVVQVADICLFTTASYSCEVAKLESTEGFPVQAGGTLSKVYSLCPLLGNNKDKRGLALDGQLKHEDTNLASSTNTKDLAGNKENLGIIVQYKVKIRLTIGGALGGELTTELPFTLSHPKPAESSPIPGGAGGHRGNRTTANNNNDAAARVGSSSQTAAASASSDPAIDTDLIQLDTSENGDDPHALDDDIVFEDFARLRLKGAEGDEHPTAEGDA